MDLHLDVEGQDEVEDLGFARLVEEILAPKAGRTGRHRQERFDRYLLRDDGAELVVDQERAVYSTAQKIVGERGGQVLGALDDGAARGAGQVALNGKLAPAEEVAALAAHHQVGHLIGLAGLDLVLAPALRRATNVAVEPAT